MDILNKLFGSGATKVADKIAGIADKFIRTKDEKAEFEKTMAEIFIEAEKEQQKRTKADNQVIIKTEKHKNHHKPHNQHE